MIVIGAGRIGTALAQAAADAEQPCTLVTRTEGWDALAAAPGEPILVATRNDDLDAVIDAVPSYRRRDLVFVQNGVIGELLASRGLQDATRGLLFFAVPSLGAELEPGPEPSPFCGRHAVGVTRWLVGLGVSAQVVEWPIFAAWELEKLVWIAAFGLLCDLHDADVGTVCDAHADDLRDLVGDLRVVGRAVLNVDLPLDWLLERLVAYSRTIPTWRASVKEWRWRNGWFVAEAVRVGVETPVHLRMLREAGYGDRLPV